MADCLECFSELGKDCCECTEPCSSFLPSPATKATCGFGATIVIAAMSVPILWAEWNVWIHFNRDGFSDNPLIPPTAPWMDGWLAFVIMRTIVAVAELITGIAVYSTEVYDLCTEEGVNDEGSISSINFSTIKECPQSAAKCVRFLLRFIEEVLNTMGFGFDVLFLVLGFFYYVVQSDCMDLNSIDKVITGTVFVIVSLIANFVKFVTICAFHLGAFSLCKCKGNWRHLRPKVIVNCSCSLLVPILIVIGVVQFGLLVSLVDPVKSFETSSIQVMRSEPYMVYFSITDLPAGETESITVTEALPLEMPGVDTNITYCLATFRYDSDSYEFVFNIALIDLNATMETNTCVCIPNHELCEPFYDNLYYGYSSDGAPYKCFVRAAALVGVDKENSPTRDRESEVHCTCEELPILLGSGSSSGHNGTN